MEKKHNWSSYQEAIFEDIASKGTHHLLVEARAGAAKTSSLIEGLKHIPSKASTLVVAFNKKIAEELIERAPSYSNLEICTLHSFGYRMIRQSLGKVKLDIDKDFKIIRKRLEAYKVSKKDRDDYETILEMKKCLSLSKSLICDTPESIDELMDDYDISPGSLERDIFIEEVIKALGDCKKQLSSISFDDMIYLPFVLNLPIDQYDRVFCDEMQDLVKSQMHLVISACKKDGRITGFCDSFQTLYGFRGAKLDGMRDLEKKLSAKTLTLPISYRCPNVIVKEAQQYVSDIVPAPNAKEGKIINILEKELITFVKKDDFILSRTNAPLVKICFQLWKNKIPATIRGKDLGPMLIGLISQSKKKTVKSFIDWLYKWANTETLRLKGKSRNGSLILDKVECLVFLAEGKEKISDLITTIKSLFENKDEKGVVNLMTCHKSKGLESNNVFLLMKTFFPGDSSQEEKNIKYVSITRAKEILYYVH